MEWKRPDKRCVLHYYLNLKPCVNIWFYFQFTFCSCWTYCTLGLLGSLSGPGPDLVSEIRGKIFQSASLSSLLHFLCGFEVSLFFEWWSLDVSVRLCRLTLSCEQRMISHRGLCYSPGIIPVETQQWGGNPEATLWCRQDTQHPTKQEVTSLWIISAPPWACE